MNIFLVNRGPQWPHNGYEQTSWRRNTVPGYNADFHLYQVEWTPGKLVSLYK